MGTAFHGSLEKPSVFLMRSRPNTAVAVRYSGKALWLVGASRDDGPCRSTMFPRIPHVAQLGRNDASGIVTPSIRA